MIGRKVFERKFPQFRVSYAPRDAILYALGIGIGRPEVDGGGPDALRFLYEKNLSVMPSFANVLGPPLFWTGEDEFGINWKRLLHVEQRLLIHRPLSASGEVLVSSKVTGIRDKGVERGALVFQQKHLRDALSEEPLCTIDMTLLLRADGGCGDFGDAPAELPELPERAPDIGIDLYVPGDLPFVYRLSGDFNPLHVDPDVAVQAGFEQPIVHGLCTMGMICRALLQQYCSFNPDMLRELSLRFAHPVYPGDHLLLECWEADGGKIRFRAKSRTKQDSAAGGITVIDRGIAQIQFAMDETATN